MKTCVFIIGANRVGKTTLARYIIQQYGGIDKYEKQVTFCRDGGVCLAGCYQGSLVYCGADMVKDENGKTSTKYLEKVVQYGLESADTIFCEGSYLDSLGLNLTNAMFLVPQRHLVVFLYASRKTLYERSKERKRAKSDLTNIIKRHEHCLSAARRWKQIGVPVLSFNTGEVSTSEIFNEIRVFLDKD